ncbi:MAG: DUF3087 family protein [Shewanella sp.]
MQLQALDKTLYRNNLNLFLLGLVLSLIFLSLSFGAGLIALFGTARIPGQPSGNVALNFLGVVLAVILCFVVVMQLKSRAFFKEIYYVWQLKQLQNRIFRKLANIKRAAAANDINALITLLFYYTSLQQVYRLDDNTLTLSGLLVELGQLEEKIQGLNQHLRAEQFIPAMLDAF